MPKRSWQYGTAVGCRQEEPPEKKIHDALEAFLLRIGKPNLPTAIVDPVRRPEERYRFPLTEELLRISQPLDVPSLDDEVSDEEGPEYLEPEFLSDEDLEEDPEEQVDEEDFPEANALILSDSEDEESGWQVYI